METTVRNVAFHRNGKWVTPHENTGCLTGVMRKWLIDHGRVTVDEEGLNGKILLKNKVVEDEMVLVFNAVEGCRLAVVKGQKL